MKIALVTGASTGIGKATAKLFADNGIKVYAAARRVEKIKEFESTKIIPTYLDITKEEDINSCVDTIIKKEGKIDILVNNAGYGSYGSVEETPVEEGRKQFDVNVFGLIRLTQLVLPHMRKNKSGKIVNISSMAGKVYMPLGGWYHATKHALEALSDSLRIETRKQGINVIVIEPGAIKSEWDGIAYEGIEKNTKNGPYSELAQTIMAFFKKTYHEKTAGPEVIAMAIYKAVTVRNPKNRYAVPSDARMGITLRKILPERLFDRVFCTVLGVTK